MLTEQDKQFYADNGYVHVKGLLSKQDAAFYRKEAHTLMERLTRLREEEVDATWGSATNGAKKTQLLHSHDVQFQTAAFSRLILNDRLTSVAADILGPNVQLHHTKMFIKPPEKGSPFPLHQDAPFFPHEQHSMIAAIVHFDDAPLEKGCVCVVPGSHKRGQLPHIPDGSWHLPPSEYPIEMATPLPATAGDALFFSYLTIHGSGINVSNEARTTVLIQMRDPADAPSYRTHESLGQGMMLAGFDPTGGLRPAMERARNADGTLGAVVEHGGERNGTQQPAMGSAMSGGMMGGAMSGGMTSGRK